MGTNCVLFLADLVLYLYELQFMQGFLNTNENKLVRSFTFTFRYIDDVLSLKIGDYLLSNEIKYTTDTTRSAMIFAYN